MLGWVSSIRTSDAIVLHVISGMPEIASHYGLTPDVHLRLAGLLGYCLAWIYDRPH
jgi:hypothetical protein